MREIIIYSGEEWQRIPELDAGETIAIQNEYGELRYLPKSEEIVKKYSNESGKGWGWIVAALAALALI